MCRFVDRCFPSRRPGRRTPRCVAIINERSSASLHGASPHLVLKTAPLFQDEVVLRELVLAPKWSSTAFPDFASRSMTNVNASQPFAVASCFAVSSSAVKTPRFPIVRMDERVDLILVREIREQHQIPDERLALIYRIIVLSDRLMPDFTSILSNALTVALERPYVFCLSHFFYCPVHSITSSLIVAYSKRARCRRPFGRWSEFKLRSVSNKSAISSVCASAPGPLSVGSTQKNVLSFVPR